VEDRSVPTFCSGLFFAIIGLVIGCQPQREMNGNEAQFVTVGRVSNAEQSRVRSALAAKGIECSFEGSIVYEVIVRSEHAKTASELLRGVLITR
jgi:hypothetical protein